MIIKKRENAIAGLIFFVLGLVIFLTIPGQIAEASFTELGARFFPRFLSILLMVMSLLLVINSIVGKHDKTEEDKTPVPWKIRIRVIAVILLIGLYIFLMPIIGFFLSSILCIGGIMLLLEVRKLYHFGILLAFLGIVYFIFVKLMYVQLPSL